MLQRKFSTAAFLQRQYLKFCNKSSKILFCRKYVCKMIKTHGITIWNLLWDTVTLLLEIGGRSKCKTEVLSVNLIKICKQIKSCPFSKFSTYFKRCHKPFWLKYNYHLGTIDKLFSSQLVAFLMLNFYPLHLTPDSLYIINGLEPRSHKNLCRETPSQGDI